MEVSVRLMPGFPVKALKQCFANFPDFQKIDTKINYECESRKIAEHCLKNGV